jgi:hypothetical protein
VHEDTLIEPLTHDLRIICWVAFVHRPVVAPFTN